MMTRTARTARANKATQAGWNRAKILATAANIPNNQARTYIAAYRREHGPEETTTLYYYLDNNPNFQDHYGKNIVSGAEKAPTSRRRSESGQVRQKTLQAAAKRRRAGSPKRGRKPVRYKLADKSDLADPSVDLLVEIRDLEKRFSPEQVRAVINFIDEIRA